MRKAGRQESRNEEAGAFSWLPAFLIKLRTLSILCVALTGSWVAVADQAGQGSTAPARLRRPVAAGWLDAETVCVANRAGSVSLVDVRGMRVQDEVPVGERLAGLAVLPDRKHVLVVDEKRNELVALSFDGNKLTVRERVPVGPYPVSVAVCPDGTRATVACLWSRRVEAIDLTPLSFPSGPAILHIVHVVRLPFAPREQCVLPGGRDVVVGDAFGGHLAVVDVSAGRLLTCHELAGHNLRGLALSADGKQLLIAHQVLDQRAPTTRENVERGVLMANVVRSIALDRMLKPGADLNAAGRLMRLDTAGRGAGDPAGLAVVDGNEIAVALGGVNEVVLVAEDGKTTRRVAVGRRPTVILPGANGRPAVVVNTFDDSLSLLDTRRAVVTGTVSLGPQPEPDGKDRGEVLFHDARLSHGGSLSCSSCHTDGHTNGQRADTLGDNTVGTPKRTLTLMGTALTDPWAWNGQVQYLHDQVKKSLEQTMHAPAISWEQVYDIVSFLHALPPPPPPEPDTADPADHGRVERGRRIFHDRGCVRCHIPPLTYTSHGAYDVGFADEHGQREFNPPSLRGVGQGYAFLHDGRAATLEQVFTKYRHKAGNLAPGDLADLLRFLRSL